MSEIYEMLYFVYFMIRIICEVGVCLIIDVNILDEIEQTHYFNDVQCHSSVVTPVYRYTR